jgi:hypothetical protein
LRNCDQTHAIALADKGKACSKVQTVVFIQRSEMKKILGKFEMHFCLLFCFGPRSSTEGKKYEENN